VTTPIDIPSAILASLTGMAEESLSEEGFMLNRTMILTDWKKRPSNGEAEFRGNSLISFTEFETEVLHQTSWNITFMKQYIQHIKHSMEIPTTSLWKHTMQMQVQTNPKDADNESSKMAQKFCQV
jgi:hypothetical protein